MDEILFQDYVVLRAIQELLKEFVREPYVDGITLHQIRDRYNALLEQIPPLKTRAKPFVTHTPILRSVNRLKVIGVVPSNQHPPHTTLDDEKYQAFISELVQRYGENVLEWPVRIPFTDKGDLQWDRAVVYPLPK